MWQAPAARENNVGLESELPHHAERLRTLVVAVSLGDVVMYTTQSCGYCVLSKRWLMRHGFAFTECDIDREARCEREFADRGADGSPYLLVRARPTPNGFDTDELAALLRH